jgi:hypothetical protein
MNLVGKIFTVLIVVMALVFSAMAVTVYATHRNWLRMINNEQPSPEYPLGLKPQLEQARAENQKLQANLQDLESTRQQEEAAAQQVRQKLESQNVSYKDKLDELQKNYDQLDQTIRETATALKTTQSNAAALRTEVDTLRQQIRDAQADKDSHFKRVVELEDQVHQTGLELSRLKETNKTLAQDLAEAMEVLRLHGLDPDPAKYTGVAPKLDTVVTSVQAGGLIEIKAGSDDGLMKGHRLEVYRVGGGRTTYVGPIEVLQTSPDKSVCKTIPESMRSHVEVGDRVASSLK